nr:Scr1 family TA system antitoxin-like transcriptional regulator [Nocardiopsis metallicus]
MWWVIGEAVLTCQIGDNKAMRTQLEHHLEPSDHPRSISRCSRRPGERRLCGTRNRTR